MELIWWTGRKVDADRRMRNTALEIKSLHSQSSFLSVYYGLMYSFLKYGVICLGIPPPQKKNHFKSLTFNHKVLGSNLSVPDERVNRETIRGIVFTALI